jgi:hypothetical protein
MTERALDAACRDCGEAVPFDGERALRCAGCFDTYLRSIDHDFLASYAELGVASRRTVAETCLRALVLESPPARKVLALAIWEQFFLATSDLIGLTRALRGRHERPVVQSFLMFQLDAASSEAFFAGLLEATDAELLDAFGLPAPELVATRLSALPAPDARNLAGALRALLRDLRTTAQRDGSALLLSELAGQLRTGPALTARAAWLAETELRADQVASLVLDERRRRLVLRAVPVDEDKLGEVVDAIDCMTRACSNLIYAYLTVQDAAEEQGTGKKEPGGPAPVRVAGDAEGAS